MKQKPGGGLQMREAMQQPTDYSLQFRERQKERDRVKMEKEQRDRAFVAKLRSDQARMNAEYAPKIQKAWENLQRGTRTRPVSDAAVERLFAHSRKPSRGIEYSPASERVEMETITAPTYHPEKSRGIGKLHDRPAIF